jgi:hypothetical protein
MLFLLLGSLSAMDVSKFPFCSPEDDENDLFALEQLNHYSDWFLMLRSQIIISFTLVGYLY